MPKAAKSYGSFGPAAKQAGNRHKRGYDYQWTKLSALKRKLTPVCEVCRTALATEVHHIVPFHGKRDPNRLRWENLQSICHSCHQKVTGQK